MEEIKERVSELEVALGRFIVQTEVLFKRMERDTATFRDEMRLFREEVRRDQQQRDEDMKIFRKEVRRDQQQRDEDMKIFRKEVRLDQQQRDEDMKIFRKEVRLDQQQRDENTEKFKKTMDQRWGELANRLGSLVEDIVAPNLRTIAHKYFGCPVVSSLASNVEHNIVVDGKKEHVEYDAIAVCGSQLIVNETKAKPKTTDVKSFIDKQLKWIFECYPEHQGKIVIPVFSSLHIPENILKNLTKHKIYALSSFGETMDLLNFEEVQKKK